MLTQSRISAFHSLKEMWTKRAAHHEDYRGINTCIRDLEQVLDKPDVIPPAELKTLLNRVDDHLAKMRGRNFQYAGDPTDLLKDLRAVLVTAMEPLSQKKEEPVGAGKK